MLRNTLAVLKPVVSISRIDDLGFKAHTVRTSAAATGPLADRSPRTDTPVICLHV